MEAWPLRIPSEQRQANFPCYAVLGQVFSADEARRIIEFCQQRYEKHEGTLVGPQGQSRERIDPVRKGHVHWVDPGDSEANWIYQRCTAAVLQVNHHDWQFELDYITPLQFTCYDQLGDHYTWHVDSNIDQGVSYRKLSFTIQLSHPHSYEGGDLELLFSPQGTKTPRDVGTFTAFPSMVTHRVTPITRGKRYSLVGWVTGPKFR
jgi:PKHD-type hydroxylase